MTEGKKLTTLNLWPSKTKWILHANTNSRLCSLNSKIQICIRRCRSNYPLANHSMNHKPSPIIETVDHLIWNHRFRSFMSHLLQALIQTSITTEGMRLPKTNSLQQCISKTSAKTLTCWILTRALIKPERLLLCKMNAKSWFTISTMLVMTGGMRIQTFRMIWRRIKISRIYISTGR